MFQMQIIIKLECVTRCPLLKQGTLEENGTKRKRAKAVTPTAKCTISNLFPEFTLAFFLLIVGEISEQASRQIATEELNKDF